MEFLPTLWFILIAVLWIGYLVLDGFDLGVGMLMTGWAKNESQRRVLLNSIGPVWDGNEVWLVTAAGATFAAFPHWYASMFAGLYIPLTLALVALILRAVSIEYRGKAQSQMTRNLWTWAMAGGSFVAAFAIGAMLALTTTGLPLDEFGDRVGGPFAWLNGWAILGGLAVVGISLAQGWAFLSLKTLGAPREAGNRQLRRYLPIYLLPAALWAVLVVLRYPKAMSWAMLAVAVLGLALAWACSARRMEGLTFTGMVIFIVFGVGAIFTSLYPNVLPSTIDEAYNLTVTSSSSSEYTLSIMAVVTAIFLPLVLAYSAWSYWMFRQRLGEHHIPESAVVTPV
ncbi:MAG: cytochrome d ubiquinol oxidase subunit II [Micrococcaceae bacterium]|nr:cytochrome d ubiquinol oxidase subunit II [Micrococcaceae bacterium]